MKSTTPGISAGRPRRKRGGQPANANALKHGIYSRHFTPEEHLALDRDVAGSLKDEAEMLRLTTVGAADVFLARPESDTALSENVFALRTISISIARLVSIILTRVSVLGDPDRREREVDAMLALMVKDEQRLLPAAVYRFGDTSRRTQPGDRQESPPLRRGETHRTRGVRLAHDAPLPKSAGFGLQKARVFPLPKSAGFGLQESPVFPLPKSEGFGEGSGVGLPASPATPKEHAPLPKPEGFGEGRGVGQSGVESPTPQPSKKKEGAPLGNSNALKHGFYARDFTPSEKALLKADDLDHLLGEEDLLHVLIARTWRSLRSVLPGGITSQEYFFALRCLTYASFVVEKIQRVRRRLFGDSTELEKDIQQGLAQARKDLGINNFLDPENKSADDIP